MTCWRTRIGQQTKNAEEEDDEEGFSPLAYVFCLEVNQTFAISPLNDWIEIG